MCETGKGLVWSELLEIITRMGSKMGNGMEREERAEVRREDVGMIGMGGDSVQA